MLWPAPGEPAWVLDTKRAAVAVLPAGSAALASLVVATAACGPAEQANPVEAGRRAYMANCIACHNADPAKEGTVGPAIAGSSLELVRARVMKAEYPPGYTPKRDTRAMAPLPYLEKEMPALAAYLQSLGCD